MVIKTKGGDQVDKDSLERARKNLKRWRSKEGWDQEEAAKKLGISKRHYYHLESGSRNVTMTMATKISKVFGVTFDDIYLKSDAE
jgi:putative transcriptional regulator